MDDHAADLARCSLTTSLSRIRAAIDTMPDALSRIGKYVLDNPDKVLRSSLDEVAAYAQSGQASVIRFCRTLGYEGFADFKLNLAADLARDPDSDLNGGADANRTRLGRLAVRLSESVHGTARSLNQEGLYDLARHLKASRRIDVFGGGISGMVATMLAYRLSRVGLVARAYQDAILAHEVMVNLDNQCIAIGVSETGVTPPTLQFLQAAGAAGAVTVALTARATSPLARCADLVVLTVPMDPPPAAGEITAAVAKIFVVEALASILVKL